ncbi:1-acyl-sn-glycerol-3-phosphate acyltransferase [Solitalea sp. MAHUQ-68]|uniref:1-acyl-sn-glycerol-3-phosphate acyltransferase n=1 Tax=Solitalea agri TaxID=2953739 RepID=A0A9X2F2D4_9SPHI|nr:lysophospholipid acyltransferase family protein [Solitalea agri]MCO4293417.1 1-acyl-sn-glycerol-3-phosphate acyltransferase [Solitalea agri]
MRKLLASLQLVVGLLAFVAAMLVVLPFIIVAYLIFPGKTGSDLSFFFLRFWAAVTSFFTLIFFKSYNSSKAPTDRAYVYVVNHGSYLDSLAVVLGIHQSFKPLGKIEMTKIPIFGVIYKRLVVLIDRSSKESRQKCVDELKGELSGGMSILIFPEGTMNKTEAPLAEFYDGAFRIAIETQTPIAPIVLVNSKKLLPRTNPLVIRPGLVKIVYADVVETKGLCLDDLPQLKEQVFKEMEQILIDHQSSVIKLV